ncbi:MAG: 30S ribosomal protein S2 [Euryarchaeota archaeon]|nr:30S ribosomal protein S2 [Euryarchaeota archaeon]
MAATEVPAEGEEPYVPLVSPTVYQENGIDVGTTQKSADMLRFISHVRADGIYMLDWEHTDRRIRVVSQFLARYEPQEVLVACARPFGQVPARKFAETTNSLSSIGRFVPGSLTNPRLKQFIEPSIVLVTDPAADGQVINEAIRTGLPVAAFVDANNMLRNVDVALPANNKGRRSLALLFWLLARELNKARGTISDDETWAELHELDEWETQF